MAVFPLDLNILASLALLVLAIAYALTVGHYRRRVAELAEARDEEESRRRSLSTTYGRISEQFAPFMEDYPHDPQSFRFLGSPIDGVQFTEDKVVLVEFKTNTSRLTPEQARVKRLVEQGRVEWLTFRMTDDGESSAGASPDFLS